MYAVVRTGGKQYKVAEGDLCRIEKLDVEEGASVEIDKVLMIADGDKLNIGTPYVKGGKVTATVKAHGRGKKIEWDAQSIVATNAPEVMHVVRREYRDGWSM